jgi:iron(III) transport system substrate-binding protein
MRKTAARRVGVAFPAALALAMLAACGSQSGAAAAGSNVSDMHAAGGMQSLITKAKKEGSILLYCTASQDKVAAWVKGFTAKYGIKVQIYRAPSNPLYQRFSQEEQVGRDEADVIQLSQLDTVKQAISQGYIAKYTPAGAVKFAAQTVVPGRAYPMYTTLSAVAWNTKLVPAELQAKLDSSTPLSALLDPRLKGKIAVVDVAAGGPELASDSDIVYHMQHQYGWAYMEKLAKQHPTVVSSTTDVLGGVESGDYWATLDGYTSVFGPQAVSGAPVAFRALPTSSSAEFYLSTVQQAPHPYAARLFEEWATTLPAQTSLANITQADVLIKGWVDKRQVAKRSWYHAPTSIWYGWATAPQLQGSGLAAFYKKWHALFGQAG